MKIVSQSPFKDYLFTLSILIPTIILFCVLRFSLTHSDREQASQIIGTAIPNAVELVEASHSPSNFFGEGIDYFIFQFTEEELGEFKKTINWDSLSGLEKSLEEKLSFDFWRGEKCPFPAAIPEGFYYVYTHNKENLFSNYDAAVLDLTTGCLYIKKVDT